MKNARTHARTHALRIRIAPQLLTPNPSAAPIITAAHKTHPTHTQNSTALKHPVARLIARSLSAAAQKLSNVFNAARKSLTKTHTQNSTALKHPVARLAAHNLSAAACRHNQFHILTAHPTEASQHPARTPRPVPPLRASRRAVCFFIHTTA